MESRVIANILFIICKIYTKRHRSGHTERIVWPTTQNKTKPNQPTQKKNKCILLPFGRDGRALSFRHNDLYNTDRATGTWFGLRVTVAAWGVEVCNSAAELHVHNVPAYLGPWLTIIQLLLWRFCWAVRALASRFLFCSHTHTRILYNHRPSVANTIVCGGGWWLKHDRTCASEVVGGGGDGGF